MYVKERKELELGGPLEISLNQVVWPQKTQDNFLAGLPAIIDHGGGG
jgi:hypothetical protein